VSASEQEYAASARTPVSQAVAGYLAAAAIFAGVIALFWYPGRLGLAAIFAAIVAAGIGRSIQRFTGIAMTVATLGFLFGMVIAVFLDRPIF
jgi:hypothetical protein